MLPRLIVLNGPSSSGKTTLAKELQAHLAVPYLCLSFDVLISMMPDQLNSWLGDVSVDGFCAVSSVDKEGNPIARLHLGEYAQRLCTLLPAVAQRMLDSGFNMIIDQVSFSQAGFNQWLDLAKTYETLFVGLSAPLEILEERESSRGDRAVGSARWQNGFVHREKSYDLMLNTSTLSAKESVQEIIRTLNHKGISTEQAVA